MYAHIHIHILFPSYLPKRPENSDIQYDNTINAQIWIPIIIFYIKRHHFLVIQEFQSWGRDTGR